MKEIIGALMILQVGAAKIILDNIPKFLCERPTYYTRKPSLHLPGAIFLPIIIQKIATAHMNSVNVTHSLLIFCSKGEDAGIMLYINT